LPEIATTVTASAAGDAPLAANNLLGGIAMQTAILAVTDLAVVRGALTFFTPRSVLLVQGVLLALLLALVLCGVVVGERFSLLAVGLWPLVLFGVYMLTLYETYRYQGHQRWQPTGDTNSGKAGEEQQPDEGRQKEQGRAGQSDGLGRLFAVFAALSLVVLAAGWTVARVGGALAEQTGLGGSFIGATLVAVATSLPELSTTVSAARAGAYSLAVSNIFGSNALLVALFLPADIAYRDGLVLDAVDQSAVFGAAAGVAVTCVYLWGLLERQDRTVLRAGWDSAIVLVFYLGSLVGLYLLR
jgi:cation:H+ antiporter